MEIKSSKYLISSADYKQCPKPDRPEYAFIGRSNVGKSSLINMLCNNKGLAKISSSPGKTKLINHFEIISSPPSPRSGEGQGVRWYIVDLPGYGYAVASQRERRGWSKMIEDYIRKRENLGCLFVLIDSRHKPQSPDIEFINKLGEWRVPFVLLFTKSDKNKSGETGNRITTFLKTLSATWEKNPHFFITSAVKKTGRKELLDYIAGLNSRFIYSVK